MLIDFELSHNEEGCLVQCLKGIQASARCIVMVEDMQEQQRAIATGADAVLLRGSLAAHLLPTIEKLLTEVVEAGVEEVSKNNDPDLRVLETLRVLPEGGQDDNHLDRR